MRRMLWLAFQATKQAEKYFFKLHKKVLDNLCKLSYYMQAVLKRSRRELKNNLKKLEKSS